MGPVEGLTGLHRADMGRSMLRPYTYVVHETSVVHENVSRDRLCLCGAVFWCVLAAIVSWVPQSLFDRVMG